jgi:hypothetical protein
LEENLFLAPGEGDASTEAADGAAAQRAGAGNVISEAVRLIRG